MKRFIPQRAPVVLKITFVNISNIIIYFKQKHDY